VPQADLCLPVPQPAHAAVSAHRPGRAPDSPRGSERAAPHRELGDGVALWAYRSTAGRLIYLPIGANCQDKGELSRLLLRLAERRGGAHTLQGPCGRGYWCSTVLVPDLLLTPSSLAIHSFSCIAGFD